MTRKHIVFVCLLSQLIGSCAHSPENFTADAASADQKCASQHWNALAPKVGCFDAVEAPVVKQDMPFAVPAFQTFSLKRSAAAVQFDGATAPATLAWTQFNNGVNRAAAILTAHEPLFMNQTSTLRREFDSINFDAACQQPTREEKMQCFGAIGRPIWERDAPGSLAYFDEFQDSRLALARQYDASGSGAIITTAAEQYKLQSDAAIRAFYTEAKQALQATEAQAAADKARAQERTAQSLKALGQFVGTLAAVTVGAAVVVAGARASAYASAPASTIPATSSLRCQTNTYAGTTFTNCN